MGLENGQDMDRLDTLLERLLAQELTENEEVELNALLLESPEARRRFWDASEMDMMLRDHHDAERPPPPTLEAISKPKGRVSPAAFAVTMCLLGMMLLLGWQTLFNQKPNTAPLADVSASRDAVWQQLEENFEGGLPAGDYHLKQGITQLHWPSGATAALQGPARFVLKESEVLDLKEGQVGVHVPPGAIGFIVRTPNGDVVDHGTDFGVRVEDNKTDAHLFAGEIEVVSGEQRLRLSDPSAVAFRDATDLSQDGSANRLASNAIPASFPLPRQQRVLAELSGGFDNAAKWGNGFPEKFGVWDGDRAEVVLGEFEGVRPQTGAGMLRFVGSGAGQKTVFKEIASQHIYWIDLAPYQHLVKRGAVSIHLACSFNRVKGDQSTDTQFGLMTHVCKGKDIKSAEQIRRFAKVLYANANENDWEGLKLSGVLPPEATMVMVEIHALENVNNNVQSGETEFAGHFADSLTARLEVDLRSAHGQVQTP